MRPATINAPEVLEQPACSRCRRTVRGGVRPTAQGAPAVGMALHQRALSRSCPRIVAPRRSNVRSWMEWPRPGSASCAWTPGWTPVPWRVRFAFRIAVARDDAGAIMTRLCAVAVPALVATLDDLARGDAAFAAQAESGVSLAPKMAMPIARSIPVTRPCARQPDSGTVAAYRRAPGDRRHAVQDLAGARRCR